MTSVYRIEVDDRSNITEFLKCWWISSFKSLGSVERFQQEMYVYKVDVPNIHPDDPTNELYCINAIESYPGTYIMEKINHSTS